MPIESITVLGIAEVCQALDEVGSIVATRGHLKGLNAAGDVIEAALWKRTPIDLKAAMNAAHGGNGALITRLNKWVEVDPRGRGGTLDVGYGALGHIALWHEYGWKLTGHRPKKDFIKDVPQEPFMRQAFDVSAERAVDAYVEAVKQVLKESPVEYTTAAA